ncbi:SAV_915 family protein [Streptomyces sp. NPDC059766]|uniref:SAV_915 family protein n=1 Tax=Streptomyces sp. NPDC059766 TaxID=3346940 RepID=UPI003654A1F2
MSAVEYAEDPEPSERFPAGPLFVPVRSGPASCTARFFRTPLGGRTAVGFTSAAKLTATLGAEQACIRLSEPALRALAAPLGVTVLTVDPQFSAPAAGRTTATVRERQNSWRRRHPVSAGALRVTDTSVAASPNPR